MPRRVSGTPRSLPKGAPNKPQVEVKVIRPEPLPKAQRNAIRRRTARKYAKVRWQPDLSTAFQENGEILRLINAGFRVTIKGTDGTRKRTILRVPV